MGEARYYMKALFESPEKAEAAVPEIEKFLKRMAEAADEWQGLREHGDSVEAQKETNAKLRARYADVFEGLDIPTPADDKPGEWGSLNYLAGELCSPAEWEFEISSCGDVVMFSGEVWHFADWDRLGECLKTKFGAIITGWISEEAGADYYGQIVMN